MPRRLPHLDSPTCHTFQNAPEYLDILKLEAQKAAAEAERHKAQTEVMLARAKLIESLTSAGCSKEEIMDVLSKTVEE
jgi:hypothetical protein